MRQADIEHIRELIEDGFSSGEIAEMLYVNDMDTLTADRFDDSDEGISNRYGISNDDRFDIRGREMRATFNDAGEPYWI
ncbi:hypothetical protein [Agrobacterium pusense]|uniref:hypothetical protein n=1 Tax=Agrobacterium pusense TaxID=648995 RepID=UPI000D38AB97|nr:hypothetical protein [Agrobacterium pusense]PTV70255.1 hypothetical protein DBL06_25665 [Agrobacterium pusense]